MGAGWQRTKRIGGAAFRPVRGRDLSLHAAAITFYGAIAVVPVALLAIWLTGLVAGADHVRRLTSYAINTLPADIGANRAVAALVEAGQARALGHGRSRRWLAAPAAGFATTLLLPVSGGGG